MSAPLPSYQCYSCMGRGNCCRVIFLIRISAEERERIRAQGWEAEAEFHGIELFIPAGNHTYVLAHREIVDLTALSWY